MQRHRDIAGSPARSAADVWTTIRDLIADTVTRSDSIEEPSVIAELDAATPAAIAVIAGGHSERTDFVLLAADLHLTIRTVSGTAAFKALDDENLNPVPGAASTETWALHFPRPAALGDLLDDVIGDSSHLTSAPPPAIEEASNLADSVIDLTRLDPTRRT